MSLIGSLEDLSLGDILQIISLSQKSGVLVLRTDEGEGRIVFRDGLVSAAATKGGPNDLRDVLVGGGFIEEQDFAAIENEADLGDHSLEDLLISIGSLSAERLDSLRRETVESAVIIMFRWTAGDFSFDVREGPDDEDPQITLQVGINPQYLAMEAARYDDEADRGDGQDGGEDGPELSAHEMFGVTPDEDPDPDGAESDPVAPDAFVAEDVTEAVALADFESEEESRRLAVAALAGAALRSSAPSELEPPGDASQGDAGADSSAGPLSDGGVLDDATLQEVELLDGAVDVEPETPVANSTLELDRSRPIVVIDAELAALEWTKSALADTFERVHIFQRPELGLARIRQYLARAIAPIVLLAPDTPGDRLSGIRDSHDFVRRLKQQAARTHVVWLHEDGARPLESVEPADAIATRPANHHLRNESAREQVHSLTAQLVDSLCEVAACQEPSPPARSLPASGPDLDSLKRATQHLRDASTRGEVLPLVIDFAAKSFRRVAMWMIRDGVAVGMAQRGLELCGGPGDDALRAIQIVASESATLASVLEERRPAVAASCGDEDAALVMALGDRLPKYFYLAPIESGGRVVAVVYGDDLPGAAAPGDTSALEVVLHHAGLALDRASLERALAEAESDLAG